MTLAVLSGRVRFSVGSAGEETEAGPGALIACDPGTRFVPTLVAKKWTLNTVDEIAESTCTARLSAPVPTSSMAKPRKKVQKPTRPNPPTFSACQAYSAGSPIRRKRAPARWRTPSV